MGAEVQCRRCDRTDICGAAVVSESLEDDLKRVTINPNRVRRASMHPWHTIAGLMRTTPPLASRTGRSRLADTALRLSGKGRAAFLFDRRRLTAEHMAAPIAASIKNGACRNNFARESPAPRSSEVGKGVRVERVKADTATV